MDIELNGKWFFFIDKSDNGIKEGWYSPNWFQKHKESAKSITIPSNFNTYEGLDKYDGTVWYFLELPNIPYRPISHEYSIEFDGVNYFTEVWINGYKIGSQEGKDIPLRFNFSPRILSLGTINYLCVRVNSELRKNTLPSDRCELFNWAGIYRDVRIILLENTRVYKIKIKTEFLNNNLDLAQIILEYSIKNPQEYLDRCYLEQIEPEIEYEIYYLGHFFGGTPQYNKTLIQTGSQYINPERSPPLEHISHEISDIEKYFSEVSVPQNEMDNEIDADPTYTQYSIEENQKLQNIEKISELNQCSDEEIEIGKISRYKTTPDLNNVFTITVQNPSLWSPNSPDLYEISLRLNGIDEDKHIRFGFRKIEVKSNHIYLNNHPIYLKGISLREELISVGQRISIDNIRKDIIYIKSVGFNAVRTISPHDENLMNIADEEGLLIFEDIPLNTFSDFKNPKTNMLAFKYINKLIKRDHNHPSTIIWSLGNDLPIERIECRILMKNLIKFTKSKDSTRLVTYETNRYSIDTFRKKLNSDLNCVSLTLKLNYDLRSIIDFILDMIYFSNRNHPLIISKFGIEAKRGLQREKMFYSETYQMLFLSYLFRILNVKPYVSGWFLHTFRDFRSPYRINKYQKGFDRSGIIDEFNNYKLIGRLMNHFLDTKEKSNKISTIPAYFCSFLLKPLELFVSLIKYPYKKKISKRNKKKFYILKEF
ncbi:MAG: glycoside hydrolase family 2 TIM barrel-domain containing protein [Promethearchaeota archaeon]